MTFRLNLHPHLNPHDLLTKNANLPYFVNVKDGRLQNIQLLLIKAYFIKWHNNGSNADVCPKQLGVVWQVQSMHEPLYLEDCSAKQKLKWKLELNGLKPLKFKITIILPVIFECQCEWLVGSHRVQCVEDYDRTQGCQVRHQLLRGNYPVPKLLNFLLHKETSLNALFPRQLWAHNVTNSARTNAIK